jgi:hypothetical protein
MGPLLSQKFRGQYGSVFELFFVFSSRIVVIADMMRVYEILLKRPKLYRRINLIEAIELKSSLFSQMGSYGAD